MRSYVRGGTWLHITSPKFRCRLGPVDNYLSQTIMQVMQIMDMKAWAKAWAVLS